VNGKKESTYTNEELRLGVDGRWPLRGVEQPSSVELDGRAHDLRRVVTPRSGISVCGCFEDGGKRCATHTQYLFAFHGEGERGAHALHGPPHMRDARECLASILFQTYLYQFNIVKVIWWPIFPQCAANMFNAVL
jgi:hypothetical protein